LFFILFEKIDSDLLNDSMISDMLVVPVVTDLPYCFMKRHCHKVIENRIKLLKMDKVV